MKKLQKDTRVVVVSKDTFLLESVALDLVNPRKLSKRLCLDFISDPEKIVTSSDYEAVVYDLDVANGDLQQAALHLLEYKNSNRLASIILIGCEKNIAAAMALDRIAPLIERSLNKPLSSEQVFVAIEAACSQLGKGLIANFVSKAKAPYVSKVKAPLARVAVLGLSIITVISFFLSNLNWHESSVEASSQVEFTTPNHSGIVKTRVETTPATSLVSKPVNAIYDLALAALNEGNVILPRGNNALFYLNNVLGIDPYHEDAYKAKLGLLKQLRASFPQALSQDNFVQADKIIEALIEGDPFNQENSDLRSELNRTIDRRAPSKRRLSIASESHELAETK